MTIQARQALWIQQHGDAWQARKADLYLRHPSKTTTAALAVLFRHVTEGH